MILQMRKNIAIFCLTTTLTVCAAARGQELVVQAIDMRSSQNVSVAGDHVVLWGMGSAHYTWIALPTKQIPFEPFSLTIEMSADTAASLWPVAALAFNDSSAFFSQREVKATTWTEISMGQVAPQPGDSLLYVVFTNDYLNRDTGQDLNLKIRKLIFREVSLQTKNVRIGWHGNKEPDLAGYRLYFGNESGRYHTTIDVGLTNAFELRLTIGTEYFFALTAYDKAGNESGYSDEVAFYCEPSVSVEACDLDSSTVNDMGDWLLFQRAMNSQAGDDRYLAGADFDNDGRVTSADELLSQEHCNQYWVKTTPVKGELFKVKVFVQNPRDFYGLLSVMNFDYDNTQFLINPDGASVSSRAGVAIADVIFDTNQKAGKLVIGFASSDPIPPDSTHHELFTLDIRTASDQPAFSWSPESNVFNDNLEVQPSQFDDPEVNNEPNQDIFNRVFFEIAHIAE